MEPEKDIFEQWAEERAARPWYKKAIDSVSLWWENEGRFFWRHFKTGIKNLWYWLPIIWKDRNWDDSFIFTILSHKLKAQSEYIGNGNIHTRAKRDAEVMMTCVRLIERVKDEWYVMEYMDYHKNKTWFEPYEGKEGYSKWVSRELEENFDDYFAKYPLIYKRVMNGEGVYDLEGREDNKNVIAMNIAKINHDRARKLLFKIMEQNIERWWN